MHDAWFPSGRIRATALLLLAVLILVLPACKNEAEPPLAPPEPSETRPVIPAERRNPFTGIPYADSAAIGKRPYGVVVENISAARPHWGLCSADLVVEGLVEGGITRMLWLYGDLGEMPKVGPVRSAREDFVEIAEGLDAIFVHWGSSPSAKEAMSARAVSHIDGIRYTGEYFFRDGSRNTALEHRGYTSGTRIQEAAAKLSLRTDLDKTYAVPFQFVEEETPRLPSGGACRALSYRFSGNFEYDFEYHEDDGLYYQHLNGKAFVDDDGKQRTVTNIILLYLDVKTVDSKGRVDMDLSGGEGLYLSGGAYEHIRWEKGRPASRLKLYGADGRELRLNLGKGYLGLVPLTQESRTQITG